jgi:hypothetical protein
MNMKPSSDIEFIPTDKGYVHIKQTLPLKGEIAVHVSQIKWFVDLLRDCGLKAAKLSGASSKSDRH